MLLIVIFFFSSRRRHTRSLCDWSSDVCSSDLRTAHRRGAHRRGVRMIADAEASGAARAVPLLVRGRRLLLDRTLIMGVVNASPEPFSDGGRANSIEDRVALATDLIAAGAEVIDVGGQSAVTNQPEIDAQEELAR